MDKPELKQFGDLTLEDFDRQPVWIACHTADYSENWYDDTDEETFRPWSGTFPVDAPQAMLLVKASFELKDGSEYPGFMTPTPDAGDLGTQQPYLFVGSRCFGFWGGIVGISVEERQALYAALEKRPNQIFPLRFSVQASVAIGATSGRVDGFYQSIGDDIQVEI